MGFVTDVAAEFERLPADAGFRQGHGGYERRAMSADDAELKVQATSYIPASGRVVTPEAARFQWM